MIELEPNLNSKNQSGIPFGLVAVGFGLALLLSCVFLPLEIQIGGRFSHLSSTGLIIISLLTLLGIWASVCALLHPDPFQKLLGISAAIFSAVILTTATVRVLQYLP